MRTANWKLVAILLACSLAVPAWSTEVLDNAKVVLLVKDGVGLEVILTKIEKATAKQPGTQASAVRFDDSTTSISELQKACKEAAWTMPDITTLQKKMIEVAGRDQSYLKELVDRALNVFENADEREYPQMMRILVREGKRVVPYLINNLEQESDRKRAGVVEAIGRVGERSDDVVRAVMLMLTDRSKPVREKSARAMVALAGPKTVEDLLIKLKNPTEKVDAIALTLGYLRDERAIGPLTQVLRSSSDSDARICSAFALGELRSKSPEAVGALLEAVLDDRDEKLRETAANALIAKLGDRRAPSYMIKAFHRFRPGRADLVRNFAYMNPKDINALEFLVEECENEDLIVKKAINETLVLITGEKEDDKDGWRQVFQVLRGRPDWIQAPEAPRVPDAGSKQGAQKPAENRDTFSTSVR